MHGNGKGINNEFALRRRPTCSGGGEETSLLPSRHNDGDADEFDDNDNPFINMNKTLQQTQETNIICRP